MKIFIIAILALVGVTGVQGEIVETHHCWWETGNYTSNIVARLRQDDINSSNHWQRVIDQHGSTPWLIEHQKPKYSHITTNTVHWMKAHAPEYTNTTPYIEIKAWHRWGWMNIYWKERLTDPKWETVCYVHDQHWGVNLYRIYMHPKSELTQRMLNSKTGFFSQNCGTYTINGVLQKYQMGKIYSFDMSNFFPKPTPPTELEALLMKMEASDVKSAGAPPVPQ